MTNMADCISSAVKAGQLDPARASQARLNFQQLAARYENIMPRAQAHAAAAADLKEATEAAARRRFHAVTNQLQAMRRLRDAVETADNPAAVLRNLIEYSEGSGYKGESVRSIKEAYENQIRATISETLNETGLNVAGASRNKARLENLIRELHGEATGDVRAVELSNAVQKAQDDMRRAFNAHGGDIGKIDGYGVMHTHDIAQLRKSTFNAWRDDIEGKLAWDKIDDAATGKPFAAAGQVPSRAKSEKFLKDVYEGITTRDWDDKDPSMSVGGRALYNQRAEKRVLHFKSGSDWLAYNKSFGATDPFSAMINGLSGLASDVALMRVLGPNPRAGLEYATQVAKKRVATVAGTAKTPDALKAAAKLETRVNHEAARAKAMLSHVTGDANVPEHAAFASFMSGTRSVLTSIQLGSAVVSSFSDLATMRMASKIIGLNPNNAISKSVQLMASHATRQTAARMGYVANTLADAGGGSSRYFGELFGAGIPERLAGFTLRASGLSFITDMRRIAFKMEFSGFMADNADRAFDRIDDSLRQILQQRGISSSDWDALRDPAARFVDQASGADFITPSYWLEAQTGLSRAEAEGLSMRLDAIMSEHMEYAIPSASIEGRAFIQGASVPGTLGGELLRSGSMYKSFAYSLTLGQVRRWKSLDGPMSKFQYAVEMSASLLLMGAISLQLKEIIKGNDPRPMNELKFWGAALMQGGGLGIFGDFFASETNRMGGGFAQTLAGPVIGFGSDIAGPILSNAARFANGDDLLIGRDVANFVRRDTPFFSSHWASRAAYDRMVADTLQRWLDPDAEAIWRRQERQRERDYGATAWWGKGDVLPSRAPDLSNVTGAK
ncbi:hypothetical protein [Pacificibacter marinus]|uniref:hypothetical protein n=1 Tax=Pacificibacter marinus TaxID=658057 RepID=UPI001C07463E|nr:hypothetical protein [Pacificibacter marinus]MBU2867010.1 hypothetical protein [Pacificibacter marinus]